MLADTYRPSLASGGHDPDGASAVSHKKSPSASMSRLDDPIDWQAVRGLYEAGAMTVAEICKTFGLRSQTLYQHRKKERWAPRRSAKRSARTKSVGKANPREKLSAQESLLDRLYNAFDRQVTELEARFADPARSDGEEEKTARTLGTLARTLEKLIELENSANAKSHQDEDGAADLDRLQQELARRVARLGQTS